MYIEHRVSIIVKLIPICLRQIVLKLPRTDWVTPAKKSNWKETHQFVKTLFRKYYSYRSSTRGTTNKLLGLAWSGLNGTPKTWIENIKKKLFNIHTFGANGLCFNMDATRTTACFLTLLDLSFSLPITNSIKVFCLVRGNAYKIKDR